MWMELDDAMLNSLFWIGANYHRPWTSQTPLDSAGGKGSSRRVSSPYPVPARQLQLSLVRRPWLQSQAHCPRGSQACCRPRLTQARRPLCYQARRPPESPDPPGLPDPPLCPCPAPASWGPTPICHVFEFLFALIFFPVLIS